MRTIQVSLLGYTYVEFIKARIFPVHVSAMEASRPVAGMNTPQLQQGRVFMMNKGGASKQTKKEKVVLKNKLKLLKGLSKDLSTSSGMASSLDHHHHHLLSQVRGKIISEASEVLLKQLQQLRTEEKEFKRRRKQEKAKLSDSQSDCVQVANEESSTSCLDTTTTIQVCMGNKCKKSGGGALLEEFQRLTGVEGAVVACKCMGKCKNGPNVRLSNSLDDAPTNPLFIGVALDDVRGIVANFRAPHNASDLDLSPAHL